MAPSAAEQPGQGGRRKHPDETDQDDSEADQDGVPDQDEGGMPCDGGVKDGKNARQLPTNQDELEAIELKDAPRRPGSGSTKEQGCL